MRKRLQEQADELIAEQGRVKEMFIGPRIEDANGLGNYYGTVKYKTGEVRILRFVDFDGELDLSESGFNFKNARDDYHSAQMATLYFTHILRGE